MDKDAVIQKAKELKDAEVAHAEQVSINNIQQTAQRAQQQLADLVALGVPLGWKMYPNCPYGNSTVNWNKSSPKCKAIDPSKRDARFEFLSSGITNTLLNDPAGFCLWFLIVVMTGGAHRVKCTILVRCS